MMIVVSVTEGTVAATWGLGGGGDQLLTTMTHSAPSVHFVQLLCNFCAICARVCTHILPPCTHYKIIQNMILPKKHYI